MLKHVRFKHPCIIQSNMLTQDEMFDCHHVKYPRTHNLMTPAHELAPKSFTNKIPWNGFSW